MTNFLRLKWQQFNEYPDALLAPLFSLLTLLVFIAIGAIVIFYLIGCTENEQQSAITDETIFTFNGQLPYRETKDSLYSEWWGVVDTVGVIIGARQDTGSADTIRSDTTLPSIGSRKIFIKPGVTVRVQ